MIMIGGARGGGKINLGFIGKERAGESHVIGDAVFAVDESGFLRFVKYISRPRNWSEFCLGKWEIPKIWIDGGKKER